MIEVRAVEGWRFEVLNPHWPLPEVGWCFGLGGASRLIAMATPTGFRVYDSDNEVEHHFTEVIALVPWPDEHEEEHAGFTTVQSWSSRRPAPTPHRTVVRREPRPIVGGPLARPPAP